MKLRSLLAPIVGVRAPGIQCEPRQP